MWIMLTEKLLTNPSPPKMSIHWAISWPDKKCAESQFRRIVEIGKNSKLRKRFTVFPLKYRHSDRTYHSSLWKGNKEPHWAGVRKIVYKDNEIRIFPHEFSILTPINLKSYLDESHIFVSGNAAERSIELDMAEGDKRFIYDAALLDGCNKEQAKLMALGLDVSEDSLYPPPIGWYKIIPEYGSIFCNQRELIE